MRIVFMGTPESVLKPLSILHEGATLHGHDLVAVVSQMAKPIGRSKLPQDPPVAIYAKEHHIETLQPENVSHHEFIEKLKTLKPDIVITAAYGQILNDEFLSIPSRATINIHPSLLPKYRGATPVQTALLNGDVETGVTLLFTVKKLDAGSIIIQEKLSIDPDETAEELLLRLFKRGGELLFDVLDLLKDRSYCGREQSDRDVTICRKIKKGDGLVDWCDKCQEICNRYRAFQPWPGVYSFLNGKQVILSGLKKCDEGANERSDGTSSELDVGRFVFDKKEKMIKVRARDGFVWVGHLKPAGGKTMDAAAFWNGLRDKEGAMFKNV